MVRLWAVALSILTVMGAQPGEATAQSDIPAECRSDANGMVCVFRGVWPGLPNGVLTIACPLGGSWAWQRNAPITDSPGCVQQLEFASGAVEIVTNRGGGERTIDFTPTPAR